MTDDDARRLLASRVSRETMERFDLYAALLIKWQRAINLIAPDTIQQIFSRHILDSAQLLEHAPQTTGRWLDVGSGAGFPGLACAIAALDHGFAYTVTLVESDQRKAAFLREVARQTDTQVNIHPLRIEDVEPQASDVISARALAPLPKLLRLLHRHARSSTVFLLPKGQAYRTELASAEQDWQMNIKVLPSLTSNDAVILKLSDVEHV